MEKLFPSKVIQGGLMSETFENSAFLTGIKKINNNSKFVMANSWIISNINS